MKKIIYKATNTITEEVYIGQTTNTLHNRKVDHIYEAFKRQRQDKFHAALREFGCRVFLWEIIGQSNSYTNLAKKECELIKKFDTIENGYNTQIRKDIKNAKRHRKNNNTTQMDSCSKALS